MNAKLPLVVLVVAGATIGCDALFPRAGEAGPAPAADEVARHYTYEGNLSVEMSGNVAQVTVEVDPEPYRRGGDLWAKSMPYIFLFSSATRAALEEHTGLGGVRVITRHPNGDMMAQALLERDALRGRAWDQALSIAGQARTGGTARPGLMRDLVRWGEDHTEFEYNPVYISP